jgi:hypothetical protein
MISVIRKPLVVVWTILAWSVCCVLVPGPLSAQFNGDFTIERHFLDIENFLDWKAYQPPVSSRYDWYFTRNGMRASVGSISMYRFYNTHEIRLEKEIGRYFTLLYEQQEDSLYRQEPIYQQAELRFGRKYHVSIIGFPQHDKKLSHSGYALSWGQRRDRSYAQISFLEHFVTYNDKNATTDKNRRDRLFDRLPVMIRLDLQHFWNNRLFLKLDHRRISAGELRIDAPSQVQSYRGDETDLTIDWHGQQGLLVGVSAKSKTDIRSHFPENRSAVLPNLKQDLTLKWVDLYLVHPLNGKDQLTVGLLDSLFENEINSDYIEHRYFCQLTTRQIYGIWEHPRSDWFKWMFSLQGGLAVLSKDFLDIREPPEQDSEELKAGIGIVMMEADQYRFFVNTTWDLDLFETRQWDGGNVQLQFRF